MRRKSVLAAMCAALAAQAGGPAVAQTAGNGLVPGIAPYAPSPPRPQPHRPGAKVPAGSSDAVQASAEPAPGAPGYDYRLGPGDKLRITVYGEEGLTGEFFVAGNGQISFPLIGGV